MEIKEYDIVIADGKVQQYLGNHLDSGVIVQDKHTKETLTHKGLIERKANRDETKWFCENTEHINFTPPKP